MRVWLITIGEPLPTDEGHPRLLRAGLIARMLAESGHTVTWWTSTFDHQRKRLRASNSVGRQINPALKLILLHGRAYRKNVSWDRLVNHWQLAREFRRMSAAEKRPDIILASFPAIELCDVAVKYGLAEGVPVVIDIRDLWPDIFLDLAPRGLRAIARAALTPLFIQARRACRDADAIFGITDPIRDWGIKKGGRPQHKWDSTFPLAYPADKPDSNAILRAEQYWDSLGVSEGRQVACFFGTFGRQVDLEQIASAARITRDLNPNVLWVLCGEGEELPRIKTATSGLKNVVLPGWVDRAAIYALMRRARVGLAPYRDLEDFRMSIPNKVIEYLSAGLPVITTVGGLTKEKLLAVGAGSYVPLGDAVSLANEVNELMSNEQRRGGQAHAAQELFNCEFKADRVYSQLIGQLQSIADAYRQSHAGLLPRLER